MMPSSIAMPAPVAAAAGAVSGTAVEEKAKLEKTAKAFEAVFVRQLIGSMRKAGLGDDDLTGSSAVDQFQEMSDARTADAMAERGGLGIAQMLLNRLAPKPHVVGTSGQTYGSQSPATGTIKGHDA